jgi:hypothetical protein
MSESDMGRIDRAAFSQSGPSLKTTRHPKTNAVIQTDTRTTKSKRRSRRRRSAHATRYGSGVATFASRYGSGTREV